MLEIFNFWLGLLKSSMLMSAQNGPPFSFPFLILKNLILYIGELGGWAPGVMTEVVSKRIVYPYFKEF
jgi:hypothetical protein